MTRLLLTYNNRRGAGCGKAFDTREEALAFMRTLRSPAVLRDENTGEIVGGIEEANGGQDDQRIRWQWWIDNCDGPVEMEKARR